MQPRIIWIAFTRNPYKYSLARYMKTHFHISYSFIFMKSYQLTYILSSAITAEDSETIKKDIESFVQSKDGVVTASHKTAPQVLAYPIKKASSGYFVTVEFQIGQDALKEVQEKVNQKPEVLRQTIVVKHPVKEQKKRRTKPESKVQAVPAADAPVAKKGKESKVEMEEVEKNLDQILSE